MKFKSSQVKGKGRGRLLGFPTINLEIPQSFELKDGIYAVKVFIGSKKFLGALHFGPIPTFKEEAKTLEMFLVDTKDADIPEFKSLEVEIIKYLRPIMNFDTQEGLAKQISKDVSKTKETVNL